jgi:hypothetical protein
LRNSPIFLPAKVSSRGEIPLGGIESLSAHGLRTSYWMSDAALANGVGEGPVTTDMLRTIVTKAAAIFCISVPLILMVGFSGSISSHLRNVAFLDHFRKNGAA